MHWSAWFWIIIQKPKDVFQKPNFYSTFLLSVSQTSKLIFDKSYTQNHPVFMHIFTVLNDKFLLVSPNYSGIFTKFNRLLISDFMDWVQFERGRKIKKWIRNKDKISSCAHAEEDTLNKRFLLEYYIYFRWKNQEINYLKCAARWERLCPPSPAPPRCTPASV